MKEYIAMDLTKILLATISAVVAWSTSIIVAYNFGRKKAKEDFRNEALQNRYKSIYAPLRTMLLNTHITTSTAVLYPRIIHRINRAWPYFIRFKLTSGFKVLFDKYGSKSFIEIEFGNCFPLKEIMEVIQNNGEWADSKLLSLIQNAERSLYETHNKNSFYLTDEEFSLACHIWNTYDRLNKRLLP